MSDQEGRRISSGGPFSYEAEWAPQRHIALLGMPGSGKTTLGRLLAAALGREFVDTDEWIAARSRMSVAQIFERHGERIFRAMELEALKAISGRAPLVIAVGGGLVTVDEHAQLLHGMAACVYLDAGLEELARRLGPDAAAERPLLGGEGGVAARLAALAEERVGIYESVSHARLECGGMDADACVGSLVEAVLKG